MATYDDSNYPYNNRFSSSKNYIKVAFNPERPLQQSELNELQSILDYQLRLQGDASFKNGAIISGMGLTNLGVQSSDSTTTNTGVTINPNLIASSTLKAVNSSIDISTFKTSGALTVNSKASLSTDTAGFTFSVTPTSTDTDSSEDTLTIYFTVQKTQGNLNKLSASLPTGFTVNSWAVDGLAIKSDLTDTTSDAIVTTSGTQINLNDNDSHTVEITLAYTSATTQNITLLFNKGYDALSTGAVNVAINSLKAEMGQLATAWVANVADTNTPNGQSRSTLLQVADGRIYLDGLIRLFDQQQISITATGRETIGVLTNETVVTSEEDSSLLDTTQGATSQFGKGADRIKSTVVLAYNNPVATTIFTLQDGKVVDDTSSSSMSTLYDILAKRTNDESGSYRVKGFSLWSEPNQLDTSKVNLVVDSGLAYVLGYEVNKGYSTTIPLDKATDTANTASETYNYSSSTSTYALNNQPVQTVSSVTGTVDIVGEQVARSSTVANPDTLNHSNVFQVLEVKDSTKTYTQGVDYKLQGGNQIVWGISSNGSAPTTGTTYTVTYKYTKTFVNNTDYKVVTSSATTPVTSVVFDGMNGDKPSTDSLVYVTYNYFLARVDLVTLDKTGAFTVIKGQPNALSKATPPLQSDPYTLQIGYVTLYPNSDTAICVLDTITRLPFSSLQKMDTRIDNLEYNSAANDLNTVAQSQVDPTALRGILTDNFATVDKADLGSADFTASYNLTEGTITVPTTSTALLQPDVLTSASTLHKFAHMVTAPYTETASVSQQLATSTINVNPYQVFNVTGTMTLDPQTDNWVDTAKTTVYVNGSDETINVQYGRIGSQSASSYFSNQNITWDNGRSTSSQRFVVGSTGTLYGTLVQNAGTQTVDSAIEYIRQRDIHFEVSNLHPLSDNLVLTFDGKQVAITPDTGFAGTQTGTVKTNSLGKVSGTFTIPEGVRTGAREVILSNSLNTASQTYTAYGTLQTTEDIINRTRVTVQLYDPLAESFTLAENRVGTSVDLYFASKPQDAGNGTHTSGITVQVRKLGDQGYPTQTILTEKTLSYNEVNVSDDASLATKVQFDDPITYTAGQGYALVIISDSDDYNMWIARAGESRVDDSDTPVMGQPYVNGTLFTSSNAQTWTADQSADLKFNINTATFSDNAIVVFDTINQSDIISDQYSNDDKSAQAIPVDKLVLLSSYLTPDNTGCQWEMKLVLTTQDSNITVDNVDWQPIANAQDMDLVANARQIQLRAIFSANQYTSPILALDNLTLAGMLTGLSGAYVSRTVDMSDAPYNHLRVQYEAYLPEGSSVTMNYSGGEKDANGNLIYYTIADSNLTKTTTLDSTWKRYVYELDTNNKTDFSNFKIKVAMTAKTSFLKPRVRKLMVNMNDE